MKIEFTPVKRVEIALIVILILFLLALILKGQTQNCQNTISSTQVDSSQILGDSAESFVQSITLTSGGQVTGIQVFIHDASGLNVPTKMALYDSGGHLLASGNATASSIGWFVVPIGNLEILPGNYFVSWDALGGSHDLTFGYKSADSPVGYYNDKSTYALFPLPTLPSSVVNINGRFAVGMCFGSSTPTPSPTITPTPTVTPTPSSTPTPSPTPTPTASPTYPVPMVWDQVVTQYTLYWSSDPPNPVTGRFDNVLGFIVTSPNVFSATPMLPAGQYYFAVTASNLYKEGDYSNVVQKTSPISPTPSPASTPENLH